MQCVYNTIRFVRVCSVYFSESGDYVFVHGIPATPTVLLEAMTVHGERSKLKDVKVVHVLTEGPAPHTEPDCEGLYSRKSMCLYTAKDWKHLFTFTDI